MIDRLAVVAVLFSLAACAPAPAAETPPLPVVALANPASVACVEGGGKLEIAEGPGGQFGVCIIKDGRRCEEWALFREHRCVAPTAPAPRRP